MITIKTAKEIEAMARGGRILREILNQLARAAQVGVTTMDLDKLARELIFSWSKAIPEAGIKSSFFGYRGFPSFVCISINDEVVHGLPAAQVVLREGDLVSLDFGVIYEGWHTDAAITVAVGQVSAEAKKLIEVTKKSLEAGLKEARPGQTIGHVGQAVQRLVEKNGFGVVRELVGHGIGRNLHEEPFVPNYGRAGRGEVLREGMTIAIEPMVTAGSPDVFLAKDGWAYKTKDGRLSAHFEQTIAITKKGMQVLT